MNVNYSEYNNVHLPIADNLVCFIKGLKHAMEKTGDFDGAMHQLKCIGYDKALETVESVAHEYKAYHKKRICTEQLAGSPEILYPTVKKERLDAYVDNRKLIAAILAHKKAEELKQSLEDAFADASERRNISRILEAYMAQDVDAMVAAFAGWDFEDLCACACIIPDEKEYFNKAGDEGVEIAFPFWGKESITAEEFKQYLLSYYDVHDDAWKLIQSAIRFAQSVEATANKRRDILWTLLKDTVGVPEEVVQMVEL